ncbi:MAG: 4-vinyl reductase [Anaerolineales bacterium]|nr:4-vinyl reductase [Anaerolineales bacterium]
MSVTAAGKYLPNRILFQFRRALDETIGRTAAELVWREAGLRNECFAPDSDDLQKAVDFSCFAALAASVGKEYGESGARAVLLRCGRAAAVGTLRSTAAIAGLDGTRWYGRTGLRGKGQDLQAAARLWGLLSDMECRLETGPGLCRFRVSACPECAGRRADRPICHGVGGLFRGMLDWFGADPALPVTEDECLACGGAECVFSVPGDF